MAKKINEIGKNKVITLAVISSVVVGIIIILLGMTYYKYRISELGLINSTNYKKYKYHYAMITKNTDDTLWDKIYQGALEKGNEQDIYIEKMGANLAINYSLKDLIKIAIAAKVDGIIIEPDDTMKDFINDADGVGIPVITVIKDIPLSKRKSFIGINTYNQGKEYGKQILELVKKGKHRITVLLSSKNVNTEQSMIYSSITNAIASEKIEINYAFVNSQNTFSSEEDIKNIIMDTIKPPDIIVCLTAEDTIGAYQTIVDYNKVGDVDIIGYYASDIILQAIEKNIINSTMVIDAKQMGAYCVEALSEYLDTGRVSDYYSVDINVINKDNIKKYKTNNAGNETK